MKYYIICGERSGELHAFNLVRSIKRLQPDASFRGIGGDMLREAGVDLLMHYDAMAVMGFWEVIKNVFKLKKYIHQCSGDIRQYNPDAVIFVDFAGFNLRVAKKIDDLNTLKYYYIAPKIWAWNQKRAHKVKKYFEQVFVILPFEEAFYASYKVNAQYVGNPVVELVNTFQPDKSFAKKHLIKDSTGLVALLPGSRRQELLTALPIFADVARAFPNLTFGLSVIDTLPIELYSPALNEPNVIPVHEDTYNLLLNADAAIVTSGTATLETALFEAPQIVTYRTSRINYEIARRLIRVKYISLINLIADEEIVKELIQDDFNVANVKQELGKIMTDKKHKNAILDGYSKVRQILGTKNAAQNAASEIVKSLTDNKRNSF